MCIKRRKNEKKCQKTEKQSAEKEPKKKEPSDRTQPYKPPEQKRVAEFKVQELQRGVDKDIRNDFGIIIGKHKNFSKFLIDSQYPTIECIFNESTAKTDVIWKNTCEQKFQYITSVDLPTSMTPHEGIVQLCFDMANQILTEKSYDISRFHLCTGSDSAAKDDDGIPWQNAIFDNETVRKAKVWSIKQTNCNSKLPVDFFQKYENLVVVKIDLDMEVSLPFLMSMKAVEIELFGQTKISSKVLYEYINQWVDDKLPKKFKNLLIHNVDNIDTSLYDIENLVRNAKRWKDDEKMAKIAGKIFARRNDDPDVAVMKFDYKKCVQFFRDTPSKEQKPLTATLCLLQHVVQFGVCGILDLNMDIEKNFGALTRNSTLMYEQSDVPMNERTSP